MSGARFAIGVTLPAETLDSERHFTYRPAASGPMHQGYWAATGGLQDARLVAAYIEATGRAPRNLLPSEPGFEQWTYRRPHPRAARDSLVQALTGLYNHGTRKAA